jgi:hypothetical protein
MSNLCPICYDILTKETTNSTPCKHIFCKRCMNSWRANHDTCPICRSGLPPVRKRAHKRLMEMLHDYNKKARLDYLHANVEYWNFYGAYKGEKAWALFRDNQLKKFCSDEAIHEMYGTPWLEHVIKPYIEYRRNHVSFLSKIFHQVL